MMAHAILALQLARSQHQPVYTATLPFTKVLGNKQVSLMLLTAQVLFTKLKSSKYHPEETTGHSGH